jgi:hypothetical protein
MTLPGTEVTISQQAPSRFAAEDTAAWFVEGFTDRGPVDGPVAVRSLSQYVGTFGERVSYGNLYDALDAAFHEGLGVAYVTRIVGPDAAAASASLTDAVPAPTLTVSAASPGAWGDALSVQVTHPSGTTFVLTVLESGEIVEVSPTLADVTAAVAWAERSPYISLAAVGTTDPKVQGPITLTGGDDDRAAADDTVKAAALALATSDFGPGQVSAPGFTTDAIHQALCDHAIAHDRIALLDLVDTATVADLTSAVAAVRGSDSDRGGAAFAPWAIVPGIAPGTTRTIPYSAIQAGLIARSEALGNNPDVPAAGENGVSTYAIGLSQPAFSDADRETLNEGGVNLARIIRTDVVTFGYRTLADPLTKDEWVGLGGARVVMAIAFRAGKIGDHYVLKPIDGRGHTIADFGTELNDLCQSYYDVDALFGATPAEAFLVDVGPGVNTPQTIAARQLRAVIELKTSEAAERVSISIVKTRLDAGL